MRALVYRQCGPPEVLGYEEFDKPSPADHEVLIRVRAASINPLDWRLMRGGPFLIRLLLGSRKGPVTPGRDVAGEVEAVGANVTSFKPGDPVFGCCRGAFAEYACASESTLVKKPEGVTFEQAAAAPIAGLTALQGLRDKGRIQPGRQVLINGAAGGVGSFAVQIARSFGADVTGVCGTSNLDMVRSLGADRVIDYRREDFTRTGQRYDLLLDNVGNLSLAAARRLLNPTGRLVIVGAPKELTVAVGRVVGLILLSPLVGRRFVVFIARANKDDLATLGELVAAGRITPVIDRRYSLDQAREAFRYLETGHARGKVVISLD